MSDYSHLDEHVLGHFRPRQDKDGRQRGPSTLDGYGFCNADLLEIGGNGEQRGFPNRISVAAYTGDKAYLTLYGNRDPSAPAEALRGSDWGQSL